jgi:serine/threonine protein kinase
MENDDGKKEECVKENVEDEQPEKKKVVHEENEENEENEEEEEDVVVVDHHHEVQRKQQQPHSAPGDIRSLEKDASTGNGAAAALQQQQQGVRFPRSHSFELMLRLLNGDSCSLSLSQMFVHPCGVANGQLCNAILHAAHGGTELGRGVHGVVRTLPNMPQLERRLGVASGRSVAKISLRSMSKIQRHLSSHDADRAMPQFISEMVHAALMSAVVLQGASPHLVRAGPFVTSDGAACYAMERMDGDMSNLAKGKLDCDGVNAVLIAVLHTLMLLQETFQMTHNDLKPGNIFVVPTGKDGEWLGYELPDGATAWCRSPGFIIKIGDPGVAVTHRIRISGMERAFGQPLGPRELVQNRMPVHHANLSVGQWVRVVENGCSVTDGVIKEISPRSSRIVIQPDNIFSSARVGSSASSAVSSVNSFAANTPSTPTEPLRVIDRRRHDLLSLNADYEAFGVHGAYQPGYDLHFFMIHFVPLVKHHGISPDDVPLLRALRSLHAFPSCEMDGHLPQHVRITMRPSHNNVFPFSAKEVLEHPVVRKSMLWSHPEDVKARVVGKAAVHT